jgi:hypothetical protein
MAEWEHKERNWNYRQQENLSGQRIDTESQFHRGHHKKFPEWLDWQCEGGWEVFKISRDYNCQLDSTWCIFRKKK